MNILRFSVQLLVGFFLFTAISAQYVEPVRTMNVPVVTSPMVMDGQASESSWSNTQNTVIFNDDGWEGTSDLGGYFKLTWDMTYLYLFADIADDYEHNFDPDGSYSPSYTFDCIEFYIDLDTNNNTFIYDENTIQLRFNRGVAGIQIPGRADVEDYNYYWENTNNGWLVEVAIPWTCAMPDGSLPEDILDYIDSPMGFDLSFSDSDNSNGIVEEGNRDAQTVWDSDDPDDPYDRTEDNAWNNTLVFGIISLDGEFNDWPIADAGDDQVVDENTLVSLDGTDSYDPEGESVSYTWSAPSGIILSNIHSSAPTFTAPEVNYDTDYQISLIVNDGQINSSPDNVIITVNQVNQPPVANAGPDQTVDERNLVILDGSLSSDPDLQTLTYSWTSVQNVNFVGQNSVSPMLNAPDVFEDETFQFVLTVNDGEYSSEPDTVNLFVSSVFDEYDTLVVYDTVYVVEVENYYNTVLISVVDNEGNLIAREEEGVLYIELFPNPADQYINIRSDMMIYEITILDAVGNVITIETVNATAFELDLGGLTAGNYILRINSESGIVNKQFVLE